MSVGITQHQWLAKQALADVRQTGHISKFIAYQMEQSGIDSDVAEREAVKLVAAGH